MAILLERRLIDLSASPPFLQDLASARYRYRWREPERVVLHQVVREQLESFLAPPRSRP